MFLPITLLCGFTQAPVYQGIYGKVSDSFGEPVINYQSL